VRHEPTFFSENLIVTPAAGKGSKYSFVFPRSDAALVEQIVRDLQHRLRDSVLQEQTTTQSMSPMG
jgi:hypothetical protein